MSIPIAAIKKKKPKGEKQTEEDSLFQLKALGVQGGGGGIDSGQASQCWVHRRAEGRGHLGTQEAAVRGGAALALVTA